MTGFLRPFEEAAHRVKKIPGLCWCHGPPIAASDNIGLPDCPKRFVTGGLAYLLEMVLPVAPGCEREISPRGYLKNGASTWRTFDGAKSRFRNQISEYRGQTSQSNSVFDIVQFVCTWRSSAAPIQRDIRGAVASRRTFDLLTLKRGFTI
jgi:hypothetical protein